MGVWPASLVRFLSGRPSSESLSLGAFLCREVGDGAGEVSCDSDAGGAAGDGGVITRAMTSRGTLDLGVETATTTVSEVRNFERGKTNLRQTISPPPQKSPLAYPEGWNPPALAWNSLVEVDQTDRT